jgi:Na+/proline symporter/C4-dicarboxylate-specific signal transduction histidine kinase
MFGNLELIVIVLGYVGLLFGVAQLAERSSSKGRSWANNPIVYSLGLGVYCTTWTFYGSVGKAAKDGMLWLCIYLGPTLAMALSPWFLRRFVRVKANLRVTSIADFISARYGKSQAVAAVVTLMLLVGIVPYIALQLRAVTGTFSLLTARGDGSSAHWLSPIVIVLMFGFTVIFGIRRLDPTERHPGMMVSLSVESLVKLFAFLAAGAFVTQSVFGGFSGFLDQLDQRLQQPTNYFGIESTADVINYLVYLLLATAAFMFLPRQFHVAVVENSSEKHVRTAAWLVPVYLVAINLFVLPIALGGLITTPKGVADQFVLALPMQSKLHALTAFVFLGGFSAAVGMLMVETMAMSTMVSNHLVLPLIEAHKGLWGLRRHLLGARWLAAALLILASYGFEIGTGQSVMLVSMGMLSFAAVTQFVPAMVGAFHWRGASRGGALAGLLAGFGVWTYTLLLPALIRSQWLPESLLTEGPAAIAWLRPEALFGLGGLSGLAHGTIWSLLFNSVAFVLGSALFPPGAEELRGAEEFAGHRATAFVDATEVAEIVLAERLPALEKVVSRYHTAAAAAALIKLATSAAGLASKQLITIAELAELRQSVERLLAGAIGAAAAHSAMGGVRMHADAKESEALAKAYARILAGLNMAPSELRRRIDYHEEKEALLRGQAAELQAKMALLDREVDERRKAEHALQELNEQLEGRVAERTRALREAQEKIVGAAHQAGRAEIATSILHNVGNVLNSVNVSLSTVAEIVSRSRIPLLVKTAALLRAHLEDVASFLVHDAKGKQIPSFVIAVSGSLEEEREKLQREVELLSKNIEHIKVIISVQQSHAKASRLVDRVDIEDLLEDALAVNLAGLEQSRVRLVREAEPVPQLTIEKHKVLQILVNLISNAKHAMSVTTGRERVLTLGTRVVDDSLVEIRVQDNGIGIPRENLRKIFQHGFTTRRDGHGFGLHGSAIAATQMYGSLTVTSEGTDRGASFVLRLPIRAPGVGANDSDTEAASRLAAGRGEAATG